MKRSFLCILTVIALFCSPLTVLAEQYTWTDGIVPSGWENDYVTSIDDITATNILQPVNPNASQQAKSLYAYLCSLTDSQKFLVGQFDTSGDEGVEKQIQKDFGVTPAMYSIAYATESTTAPQFDLEGNITNGDEVLNLGGKDGIDKVNDLAEKHYNHGKVLLLQSDGTHRVVASQVAVENGMSYGSDATEVDALVAHFDSTNPDRDMEVYATYRLFVEHTVGALKDLESRGVAAYMMRSFVEFDYHPVDGVSSNMESYKQFTRVYQQFVQSLIDSGLTGFLTVYSPSSWNNTITRYPGNEYIDVLSVTMYSEYTDLGAMPGDNGFKNFVWYEKTGKPIGLSELSCRSGDWQNVSRYPRASWYDTLAGVTDYWPSVSLINCWGGTSYSLVNQGGLSSFGNDDGQMFLESPYSLLLEDIPPYQTSTITAPGVAQLFTTADASDDYVGLEVRSYTASDLSAMGVNPADVRALRVNTGYGITFYSGANCTGTAWGFAGSTKDIKSVVATKFNSLIVTRLDNLAKGKTTTASSNSSTASSATDGSNSTLWSGNTTSGKAWIHVDLGDVYTVKQYVLKNHGASEGVASEYNTRGYYVETSLDGTIWKTADSVTNNTKSSVKRDISPVQARYVRLTVTEANSTATDTSLAQIAEWEIYGLDAGSNLSVFMPPIENVGGQIRNPDVQDDYALRFVFEMASTGIDRDESTYETIIADNAAIIVDGKPYKVLDFGAVLSITKSTGLVRGKSNMPKVLDVPAKKMYERVDGAVRFTAVVTNIPAANKDTPIYARPYVVTEQGVLYGDVICRTVSSIESAANL